MCDLSLDHAEHVSPRWMEWLNERFLFIVTVFLLLVYMLTYFGLEHEKPIRSDGAAYYCFLPSLLLYADPSLETDARARYGGEFPLWTHVRRYPPTGRYLPTVNMGVAILMLPLFLAAHALTWWFGWPWEGGWPWMQMRFPPDGYSLFYQHAAGLSGLFYFVLGMAVLKRKLDSLYSRGAVMAALAALLLGTNLLYYAAVESVHSHAYTFFLAALLFSLTDRWHRRPDSTALSLAMGALISLLFLVRPPNVLLYLWIPLCGVTAWKDIPGRTRWFAAHWKSLCWMGLAAFLLLIPQLLMWKYATGRLIVSTYHNEPEVGFQGPQLADFLFSVERGLFLWFPVTILALPGLLYMRKTAARYQVPVLALLVAYLVFLSSYRLWKAAGGFGNRYTADMVILMAFPLAAFFNELKISWPRKAVAAAAVLCVLYTLFLLTLLYRREITFYGLEASGFFDAFWWRKELVGNWLRSLF